MSRALPLLAFLAHAALSIDSGGVCKTTFVKVAGFVPQLAHSAPPLYSSSYGKAITAECYNKCKSLDTCGGFILDYGKATCYQVDRPSTRSEYAGPPQKGLDLQPDPAVSYFMKICVPVKQTCSNRAWVADLIPGYELLSTQHTVVPNVRSWSDCTERCINSDSCRSANYVEYSGTCSLSNEDFWSDPQALAPSIQPSNDYIDNQCVEEEPKFCWHDPIFNQSNIRADLSYDGESIDMCAQRCEKNAYFKCRGYSWVESGNMTGPVCHLHSDEVLSPAGPQLRPTLQPHRGAVYFERIRCTNVSVTCDPTELVVTLTSPKFKGQLYVEGHSETCSVMGSGQNITKLVLPLKGNPCDVQFAYALSRSTNRTMLQTIVVVQHHKQVQLIGDAVVKISCYLGTGSQTLPPTSNNNITVSTSVSVNTQTPQTEVTGIGNGTVTPPTVGGGPLRAKMKIVDERTGKEISDVTQIGDPLQLQITIDPPYNISYVRAGHLVAKTGSSSDETPLLLLNWEGCPPDPKVFPGLRPGSSQELIADFKAFRFPSSPVLMLSVSLTFCPSQCPLTDCGNGVKSYGKRRKRSALPEDDNEPELRRLTDSMSLGLEEIPLQIMLYVNERKEPSPPPPGHLEVDALLERETGEICLSFVALSLIAILFLLVQCIILTIVCWYLGRREKEMGDTISLRRDFNPPQPLSHHVTWADQVQSPNESSRHQGVSFM